MTVLVAGLDVVADNPSIISLISVHSRIQQNPTARSAAFRERDLADRVWELRSVVIDVLDLDHNLKY